MQWLREKSESKRERQRAVGRVGGDCGAGRVREGEGKEKLKNAIKAIKVFGQYGLWIIRSLVRIVMDQYGPGFIWSWVSMIQS